MAQSVVGGQQTVQSHCGVLVHSRHQELLFASQSKQRYHHQRRCQGEKWNGTEFRAQTSITAVVLQRPGPSRSHRNSSTRVETQQLKYYKRLSFRSCLDVLGVFFSPLWFYFITDWLVVQITAVQVDCGRFGAFSQSVSFQSSRSDVGPELVLDLWTYSVLTESWCSVLSS